MSKNIDQLAPTESLIDLTRYTNDEFTLPDHVITELYDDLILVEYTDINEDGTAIKRGNIWIPLNAAPKAWRVGRVLVAGKLCKNVKVGSTIIFPCDKGVPISKLQYRDADKAVKLVQYGIFLNEERLFGACEPVDE
jgi:hypothetical protein